MNKNNPKIVLQGIFSSSSNPAGWATTDITLEGVLAMKNDILLKMHNNALLELQLSIAEILRTCALSFEGLVRIGKSIRYMAAYGEWGHILKQLWNQVFTVPRTGGYEIRLENWMESENFPGAGSGSGISVSTFMGELLSLRSRQYDGVRHNIQTLLDYTYQDVVNVQSTANLGFLKEYYKSERTLTNANIEHKKDTESFNSWVEKATKGYGALVSQLWDSARNKQFQFISLGLAGSLQDAYGDAGDDRMMEVMRLITENKLYPRRVDVVPREQITHSFAQVYQPRFYGGGIQYIYRGNVSHFEKCITFRDIYLHIDNPRAQYAWLWEEVSPTTTLTPSESIRERVDKELQGFVEKPVLPDVWANEMARSNPLRYGWMGWSTPLDAILYLMYTIWKKLPS